MRRRRRAQVPLVVGALAVLLTLSSCDSGAPTELYELSMMRPQQTIAFKDFEGGEMRALEAAMLQAPQN